MVTYNSKSDSPVVNCLLKLFVFRVETIEAKADDHFKNYDWLIGNHSDELTPWIPVMAQLSQANYFVLPCCSYDFYGKFQRTCQTKSQYRDYLNHVFNIGEKCGFSVQEDKLRIPSTKRICFVGIQEPEKSIDSNLLNMLDKNFVPRPCEEIVRNCTKIPKKVTEEIIGLIVNALLRKEDLFFTSSFFSIHACCKYLKKVECFLKYPRVFF